MHNHDFNNPRLISPNVRGFRSKKRVSVLQSLSPRRKEHCPQGLFAAIVTELEKHTELQSETRYGYYPGGFYRMDKETQQRKVGKPVEARVIDTTNSWLGDTFSCSLIKDRGATFLLSPAVVIRRKFMRDFVTGNRTGKQRGVTAHGKKSDTALILTKKKGASCRLHSDSMQSNLFGFTGPLLTVSRPKTAYNRPFCPSTPIVKGEQLHPQALSSKFLPTTQSSLCSAKKPDPTTVIDVLIPTPKFRPATVGLQEDCSSPETKGHHKALSQGNEELKEHWREGTNGITAERDGTEVDLFPAPFDVEESVPTDHSMISHETKLGNRKKKEERVQGNRARFRRINHKCPPH